VNCSEGLSLFFVSNPFIIYNNNPIPLNSTTLFPTTNFLQSDHGNEVLPLFQAIGLIVMMSFVGSVIVLVQKQKLR
ncbi:MAG: hypothetical protein ACXACK_19415, partial [Candidatus Hodarchaeales archaeon]